MNQRRDVSLASVACYVKFKVFWTYGCTRRFPDLLRFGPAVSSEPHDTSRSAPTAAPVGPGALDGVEVERFTGRGGQSDVYLARKGGRKLALKLQTEAAAARGETGPEQFRREGTLVGALDHSAVPEVYEVGTVEGRGYTLMEFIEGESLAEAADATPIDEETVARWTFELLDVLDSIHRRGLVHRDLTPANIMFEPGGQLRLIDFGLAARMPGEGEPESKVVGAASYTAPEQLGTIDAFIDGRADLYAVGVMLYEVLAGRRPFEGDTYRELVQQHTAVEPEPLGDRAEGVSPEMEAFVRQLLQKDPADRFPDAAAAARRLVGGVLDGEPPGTFSHTEGALVGREDEWSTLRDAWRRVQEGAGRTVVIRGDAGVGKSFLAERFVRRIPGSEAPVASEKAAEGESAPLLVLRGAIRQLVESFRERRGERFEEARTELATLAEEGPPGLRSAVAGPLDLEFDGRAEPIHELDSEEYFESAVELFLDLADLAGPAILVLDDLQWLEYASRKVVQRLFARIDDAPLLVLATAREWGEAEQELLNEGVETGSAPPVRLLDLEPFDREETARLMASELGLEDPAAVDEVGEDLVDRFWSRTQGVPFLAVDYLHTLLSTGRLRPYWGSWQYDGDELGEIEVSGSSLGFVRARLERLELTDEEWGLLEAAAVLGGGIDYTLLEAVSDADPNEVGEVVERARRARVLAWRGGGYEFLHDRLREAILEEASAERLSNLHDAAARALEELDRAESEDLYATADHYRRGHPERHPGAAHDIFLRAGHEALENHGYSEALQFLEEAERLADGEPDLSFDTEERVALAEAAQYSGELSRAQREYGAAIEEVEEPLREADLRSRLAETYMWDAMESRRAREEIEAAFDALGNVSAANSTVLFIVTSLWLWVAGAVVAATGIGYGSAEGDKRRRFRTLLRLYHQAQAAEYWAFEPVDCLLYILRALYVAHRVGNSPETTKLYSHSGAIFAALDVAWAADWFHDHALEMADELDRPGVRAYAEVHKCYALTMLGHPVESERRLSTFLEESGHWVPTGEYVYSCTEVAWNLGVRGYLVDCIEWIDRARTRLGRAGTRKSPLLVLGFAADLAELGRFERAETFLDRAVDALEEGDQSKFQFTMFLSGKLVVAHVRRDWDRVFEAMASWGELELKPARTPVYLREWYAYRAYALLDYLRDEAEDARAGAEAELDDALSELSVTARGHPTLEAHAQVVAGAVAARKGERSAALEYWQRAESRALEHDVPRVLYEVRHRRARLLRQEDSPRPIARREAAAALELAETFGWRPKRRRLLDEFPELETGREESIEQTPSSRTPQGRQEWAADAYFDALQQVSLAASSTSEPGEQIRQVLEEVVSILGAERGVVLLADEESGELSTAAARNAEGETLSEIDYSTSVVEQVEATGESVVLRGPRDAARRGFDELAGDEIRSVAAAPLEIRDRSLGVIYLDSRLARGVFSDEDLEVLATLASHIPIALETVRAAQLEGEIETEREQRQLAETLHSVLAAMNETLDLSEILEALVEGVDEEIAPEFAWAGTVANGGLRETSGDIPEQLQAAIETEEAPLGGSELLEAVTHRRTPRYIRDAEAPAASPDPAVRPETVSWLGVPLAGRDSVVGVLVLESSELEAFDEGLREIAELFAGQAAVAVENARAAMRDALTGLHNRRHFQRLAEQTFQEQRETDVPISGVIVDLDNFKQVNDRHGHAAGDRVLERVADVLRREVPSPDLVARYGGEEFVALLPETPARTEGREIADRIRRAIASTEIQWEGESIDVTASVGVSELRPRDSNVESLLNRADEALYRAKEAGRNAVKVA